MKNKLKVQMVATGFVIYPDGSKKEITLTSEELLSMNPTHTISDKEVQNGNSIIKRS